MNADTVCNDTLIKEIFPKLTLKALMNLRKTNHRYRQLVSTYLKITTDSITIINVIREGGNIFSKTNKYFYAHEFQNKLHKFGLLSHRVNVERWCSGEQTLVIQHSNGGQWFVTKALLDNLWSINCNFDFKIKDEKIRDYIYQTFVQAAIDEKDDEDDSLIDITISYFYQGIEIDRCLNDINEKEEKVIKKIENFMNRCKKIANCIVYC
jgi:hypothetical protein